MDIEEEEEREERTRTSRLVMKKVVKTEPQMLPIVSNFFLVMIKARILSNY